MGIQEQFIKAVIQKVGGTDSQAAAAVGIPYKAFHAYKHGRNVASDSAILKMADFLGENAQNALAQHHLETDTDERVISFWRGFAKVACAVIFLSATTLPAHATSAIFRSDNGQIAYYVNVHAWLGALTLDPPVLRSYPPDAPYAATTD